VEGEIGEKRIKVDIEGEGDPPKVNVRSRIGIRVLSNKERLEKLLKGSVWLLGD